jgi:hypothetical protein
MAVTNEIDLLDKSIVMRIINEMNKSEDRDRRTHSFDSWRVYSGDSYDYVLERIQQTRPKSWKGYTISNVALSKVICDKLAKAYKEPPMRKVISEQGEETKTERYNDMLKEAGCSDQTQFFDLVTHLHKYGCMWVNYRQKEQHYQLMTLQPHEFAVVRNKDTGKLECVILNYGNETITGASGANQQGDGVADLIAESQDDSAAQTETYAMWTDKNHVVIEIQKERIKTASGDQVKVSVTYVENPENPDNVNKLGKIPFVFWSEELTPDYPTRSPLLEQTITYNAMMSELMTASNIQGTGQLVFKYPESMEGMFKKITRGLLSAIKLPQSSKKDDKPTEVEYINPNPDLAGQKETINKYLQDVMREHGITSGSAINMESFSSGLERAIANANVDDIIMKKQQQMIYIESEIFDIVRRYENFVFNRPTFRDNDTLQVVFKKPKILMTDTEILQNIKTKLELGLIDRADALMLLDRNLSREAAEEKVQDIDSNLVSLFGASNGNTERNQQRD